MNEEYVVSRYEDRFYWDTPENLAKYNYGTQGGWVNYEHNPVLGGKYGTCFDLSMMQENGIIKMWFSWRPKACIGYTESKDGYNWSEPIKVFEPNPGSDWDGDEINRPSVIRVGDTYKMWYSGQMKPYRMDGRSTIGYAESNDGIHWTRKVGKPVMVPDAPWEESALMCPHVLFDEDANIYKMWYSGGNNHEPNAIGYAESHDGITWKKCASNPIFVCNKDEPWEQNRVAACQVIKFDGWYYMFYLGFFHIDRGAIGMARSKDGITNWERSKNNPIIAPDRDSWNDKAVYKPFVMRVGNRWMLWYNGAGYVPNQKEFVVEQIGVATLNSDGFNF